MAGERFQHLLEGKKLTEIPRIDPDDFKSLNSDVRQEATKTTVRGLHDIGFVFVKTPEVARQIPRVYPVFQKLFSLPEDTLMSYSDPEIFYQRGYTPSGSEVGIECQAKPGKPERPDTKRNWFIGPEHDDIEVYKGLIAEFPILYAENKWPEEVPELREAATELYNALYKVGKEVLGALEKPLEYQKGFFEEVVKDSPTSMRPLHYPKVDEAIENAVGACDHTDINYVTVLPAPTREGLHVLPRGGGPARKEDWIKGMAPPGYSLVQVGDMLQHTTGGFFHSAVHKVDAARNEDRYSTALFVHARSNVNLEPAGQWEAGPTQEFLAADYLNERLEQIRLAKGKPKREK